MNSLTDFSLYTITDYSETKQKVLSWMQSFSTFCFLDNHQYTIAPHTQECIAAVGVKRVVKDNAGTALSGLQQLIDEKKTWLFGHIGYDIKNEIENVHSSNIDEVQFPDLYFFEPEIVISLSEKSISIYGENSDEVFRQIQNTVVLSSDLPQKEVALNGRLSKQEYLSTIDKLQQHIRMGDCYEINFCQEFFAENAELNPLRLYNHLAAISAAPFSAFYRVNDKWLICASPERFLWKKENKILSQPIKGTSQRFLDNLLKDDESKSELYSNAKERSENVMIVDLVRNDLSKICESNTVMVDELFGIYSFPQVHQMISTISGTLKKNITFSDIIRATFPMGSMTGAPKKKVMELIEQYETTKRGVFSGAVGYLSPEGDFDFNVVIRSIMYNEANKYLSMQAGSAITFYSSAEREWEECLLKAEAMKKALR